MGGRKKKGSKKKIKKEESNDEDSNSNDLLPHSNNSSSTHSHGSAEDPKSLDERGSDSGDEEEIVDRKEVDDVARGDELEDEAVGVAVEEETLGNGNGSASADLSVVEEDQFVKEVAVVEEDEKPVIEEVHESVGPQIDCAVEDLVEKLVESALVGVDSEDVDSTALVSRIEDGIPSAVEERKPEQVQDPVEVVAPIADIKSRGVVDEVKTLEADGAVVVTTSPVVDNGKELESTSPVVDNGKELETYNNNKACDDQPLIGSNPLPVRRTSWTGCCGIFEVFSGGNR